MIDKRLPSKTNHAPRCPSCDYSLAGLPENRCPECGVRFEPQLVQDATTRIPWERRRSLLQTILVVGFQPGRFFVSLHTRSERQISHAASLIGASLAAALLIHALGFLAVKFVFIAKETLRHGQPLKALDVVIKALGMGWSSELILPLHQVFTVILAIVVFAMSIRAVFRKRVGSFRIVDLVAALSPVLVYCAAIHAVANTFGTASLGLGILAQLGVILLLQWFMCRRFLVTSRWISVVCLTLSTIAIYGCAIVAMAVSQLLIF